MNFTKHKKILASILCLTGAFFIAGSISIANAKKTATDAEIWYGQSSVHPTGTVRYIPEKSNGGFVLIGNRLVDRNGNLVHFWRGVSSPTKVYPGGIAVNQSGRWRGGQQDAIALQKLNYKGEVIWSFDKLEEVKATDGESTMWVGRQHHDFQMEGIDVGYYAPGQEYVENGNALILAHRNVYDKRVHKTEQLLDDLIVEVDNAGNILWTWSPLDHLKELGLSKNAMKALQSYPAFDVPAMTRHAVDLTKTPGGGFDWCHINAISRVGENKWYDNGDERFHPDNIIFNSRELCMMGIIDKKTGKIVWRLGPDYTDKEILKLGGPIIGAHGAHIIPKGLPGAGNILVFDNGGQAGFGSPNELSRTGAFNLRRDHSRVLEIDPVTKEIVWEYDYSKVNPGLMGHIEYKFFSPFVSFAQRLPNGNTFITVGDSSRVIEVTPEYENVWEYINPYANGTTMVLYRAYNVPYEWVPQVKKPQEVSVTPKANIYWQLPNDKGKMPNVKNTGGGRRQ